MSIFAKGLTHDFVNNLKVLPRLIFFEKDLDMMCNIVLNGKKDSLDS